ESLMQPGFACAKRRSRRSEFSRDYSRNRDRESCRCMRVLVPAHSEPRIRNSQSRASTTFVSEITLLTVKPFGARLQRKIKGNCTSTCPDRFHRRHHRSMVRNFFPNLIQSPCDVIGQVVGKFFMHHNGPATEVDDSRRIVDPSYSAMIQSRPLETIAFKLP